MTSKRLKNQSQRPIREVSSAEEREEKKNKQRTATIKNIVMLNAVIFE